MKRVLFLVLVIFNVAFAYDRRLQNANLDFINFETQNKRPTPQPHLIDQNDTGKLNQNIATSTAKNVGINQPNQRQNVLTVTSSTTKSPVQNLPKSGVSTGTVSNVKPTATTTNVRQLIKNYNDRGTTETPKPLITNSRNNQQGNRQSGNIPTSPNQANPQPNSGASWASIAAGKNPTATTNPQPTTVGKSPIVPSSPNLMNPQGASGQPSGVKPGSNQGTSWASIAAGKNPVDNTKPQVTHGQGGQTNKPLVTPGAGGQAVKPQVGPGSPTATSNIKPVTKPGDAKTTEQPEIVSDKELADISEALLTKDVNNPSKYITINVQKKTTSFSKDDLAPEPLFTIDPEVWKIPTISAMKVLLDNYEQDTTVNEYVTPQEKNEENAFLDAVMATSVMRHLMTFLKEKGIVTPDPKQQRDLLKQTWFNMYSRGQGKIGSSGFEHIFLSEIKNNEISGLHNWLYFHLEEAAQRANYLGYLKKLDFGTKGNILKLHFNMKGIDKPVDTMFVGTSPELEMALYSLCFYTRVDKACPLTLGGQQFNLRTHNFRYRSKNMIGSAFPEI